MREHISHEVEQLIKDIKAELAKGYTEEVCANLIYIARSEKAFETFNSPGKQTNYLISLCLSTNPPSCLLKEKSRIDYKVVFELTNKLYKRYAEMFFDYLNTDIPKEKLDLVFPCFLHYHNNTMHATFEQLINYIEKCYLPSDEKINKKIGISVKELLEIAEKISQLVEDNHKLMMITLSQEFAKREPERHKIINDAFEESKGSEEEFKNKMGQKIIESGYIDFFKKIMDTPNKLFRFFKEQLLEDFDEQQVNVFLDLLTCQRRYEEKLIYPDNQLEVECKPIIKIDESRYTFLSRNHIFQGILNLLNKFNQDSKITEKRDYGLELMTKSFLEKIFNVTVHHGLSEELKGNDEHDLIFVYKNNLFIAECKAGQYRPPFRDPQKAEKRIRGDLQKILNEALTDQAVKLKNNILNGTITCLYKNEKPVLTFDEDTFEDIYCISITREELGYIATCLPSIDKAIHSKQFSFNIFDLQAISFLFNYYKKNANNFLQYLEIKEKLYGKSIYDDELEAICLFLECKNFNDIFKRNNELITFPHHVSDLYDRTYEASQQGNHKLKLEKKNIFDCVVLSSIS